MDAKLKPHLSSNLSQLQLQAENLLKEAEQLEVYGGSRDTKAVDDLRKWLRHMMMYPDPVRTGQVRCKNMDDLLTQYRGDRELRYDYPD